MKLSTIKLFVFFFLIIIDMPAQTIVKTIGTMRQVMKEGKSEGQVNLDTISKPGTYGLGPVEYLSGEIMLFDGKSYVSSIENGKQQVIDDKLAKAPFFVYAEVKKWKTVSVIDSIRNIRDLEQTIEQIATANKMDVSKPFPFIITGKPTEVKYHIVDNKKGDHLNSESHKKNQVKFHLRNKELKILGFFSKQHQGIFTHHDSFVHMHVINKDLTEMGHVDEVSNSNKGIRIWLPE